VVILWMGYSGWIRASKVEEEFESRNSVLYLATSAPTPH
jgi:hypothetical protein